MDFTDDPDGEWDGTEAEWNEDLPPMRNNIKNFRNDRYNNAYGNYRGGYGPGGGWGPPNFGPGPRPPFGPPPFAWGRGFGPRGPPPPHLRKYMFDNKSYRYLIRCGVSKDIVKTLPKELLHLIEPEYCGVCGMTLDSFASSRFHYVSKNHLKNQKKWILQHSSMGGRPNQMPLKSRDLYCELCDVQITSKVHAESHYAGKNHRAIVEGRKQPKNTFLLRDGMGGRVQQLIRREKKNLKPCDEVEVAAKEAAIEEVKASQPELYCEICKTSVTCSEQMTMHLNGKRHLAREKRHIFNMMTGEKTQPAEAELPPEEEEKEDTEEQPEGEEDNTEENKDDDWGNGSAEWE